MKKKSILLIGNSGLKHSGADGQTTKVRLYCKKIVDEGFNLLFVDLESFRRRPFSTLFKIKKYIKICDRIVLITAERGSKILLPYIDFINRKYKKPFIFPLVGISVLHFAIGRLNDDDKKRFFEEKAYVLGKKDKKMVKELLRIDCIMPETPLLSDVYKEFYGLTNVLTLSNFRDDSILSHKKRFSDGQIRLIYLSRVTKTKGIFDLLETVIDINAKELIVTLDIYGECSLNDEEKKEFARLTNMPNIVYHGPINNKDVVNTIAKYDLFVFPTIYYGEGMPGVIAESLISGTPILSSRFMQAPFLLENNKNSIFFEIGNKNDLKEKLLYIINNKTILDDMSKNALKTGKKFTYRHVKSVFLKYVCGEDNKE